MSVYLPKTKSYFTLPTVVPDKTTNEGGFFDATLTLGADPEVARQLGATEVEQGSLDGVVVMNATPAIKAKLEELTGIKLYENRFYEIPDFYPLDVEQTAYESNEVEGKYAFTFVVEDRFGTPIPNVALSA